MAAGRPRPRPARATATRPVSNPIATPAAIPALRANTTSQYGYGDLGKEPKTIRRVHTRNRPIRMDMVHTTRIKTAAKARRPQIHTAAPTAAPVQIPIRIPARILTGPPTGVPAGALTGTPIRNPMPVPMRILPEVRQAVLAGAPTGLPTGVPAGAPTGVPARATTRRPMGARMGVPLGVPPGIRMVAPAEIRVGPARNRLPQRRQNAMAASLTPMPVRSWPPTRRAARRGASIWCRWRRMPARVRRARIASARSNPAAIPRTATAVGKTARRKG